MFKAARQPPGRRHAVFECLKIKRKVLRIQPAFLYPPDQSIVIVNTLTTSRYFQSAEEKVKAFCVAQVLLVFICIERPFGNRIMCDKNKIRILILLCPFANSALLLGLQVRL